MSKIILKFDFTRTIPQQLEKLLSSLGGLTPDIEELVLPNCGLYCLNDEQLKLVAKCIPDSIRRLSIPNNHLGKRLYSFLENAPASIEFLDISHNQLIQLTQVEYDEIISSLPLKQLKLHHQDFRRDSCCFNRNLQALYLSEVNELKISSLNRQRFIFRLDYPIKSIHLDDRFWIPKADEITAIHTDAKHLILSFMHLDISEVLEVVKLIPSQVLHLALDFSTELWLKLYGMAHQEKVEYFLNFPAHLQSIQCNDLDVFKRADLLSMQSMFQEKKTVSEVISMFKNLSGSSYR